MNKKNCFLLFLLFVLLFNIAAEQERPKVGLVLGGGGARGFAHIAVLEMLEEMEIQVDLIIGVSAGAIVGGLYSIGYSPQMMKDALLHLDWTSLFVDAPALPFENELDSGDILLEYGLNRGQSSRGLSPGQEAYDLLKSLTVKIPSYIDFDDLLIPFRAGAAELSENKFVLLDQGDLAEAIRASMSIPGVFDSLNIDGKFYIDGGVLNNLPIQMARELGCDIVIASELSFAPYDLTDDPLELPDLLMSLYDNAVNARQYDMADVVIKTDLRDYSIMDFPKSQEIYSLVHNDRERILKELEKIKELLSAGEEEGNRPFVPSGSYRDMSYFTPDILTVTGAVEWDRKAIENYFSGNLKGKALEEKSIAGFIRMIYVTGNYRFVAVRIDTLHGNTVLELRLYQRNFNEIDFLLGGQYHGTLSGNSMNKISITSGIQFRGLSGPGSILSINISVVDVFGIGVQFLQPLSGKAFLTARADVMLDHHISVSGFFTEEPREERLFFLYGDINGGYYFNRYNRLRAGAFIFSINPQNSNAWLNRNTVIGVSAVYTFNSLDYLFFPTMGFFASLENKLYLPLPFIEPVFFDILSLDIQGVLPLGEFGISAGIFAGSDLGTKNSGFDNLRLGFLALDRQYFPNISVIDHYYSNKFAASLALQLQPFRDLVLLGGQVLFSLSASAGLLFDEPEDINAGSIIWNASFAAGVRLRNNFGLLLRLGIAGQGSALPMPFIAFDIGRIPRNGARPGF